MKFAIVQTIEKGEALLSVVPQHWTIKGEWNGGVRDKRSDYNGMDSMFWPKNEARRLREKRAATDVNIGPDENCQEFRCIIKRANINTQQDVSFRKLFI